jgi:2-hydroxychromene-2-carboxylate isomerase
MNHASGSPAVEFWYEFASPYSYLAAGRVATVAGAAGVAVTWQPFLLGPIFAGQGWNDSPFNIYPAKGAYMWRDMDRQCARFGLAWRRPTVFPRNSVAAARLVLAVEADHGAAAAAAFAIAVFRANFVDDRDIADPAVLATILGELDLPAEVLAQRSLTPDVRQRLRAQTARAGERGLFGAPSFIVTSLGGHGEVFWGNDRLDEALAWARQAGV